MAGFYIWVSILFIFNHFNACDGSNDEECNSSRDRELNMNVNSKRNKTGEWVSTFNARKESNRNFSNIDVDVSLKFSECRGKQIVHIQGVLKESVGHGLVEERLLFHPNCGNNIGIVNGGRSLVKINKDEEYNGVAITNRPLKNDEIFEVRLDKRISKFNNAMGIGVTTHNPNNLQIPRHMNDLKSGTWLIYLANVYINASLKIKDYIPSLKDQKVGDRLGIKRTEFGTLHMFINGVDQGPAASNVPPETYGVYELYRDATEATIVDFV